MRKLEEKDLVGKTISSIDMSAANVVGLTFSDGTVLKLWTEAVVWTPTGSIYGIMTDDAENV